MAAAPVHCLFIVIEGKRSSVMHDRCVCGLSFFLLSFWPSKSIADWMIRRSFLFSPRFSCKCPKRFFELNESFCLIFNCFADFSHQSKQFYRLCMTEDREESLDIDTNDFTIIHCFSVRWLNDHTAWIYTRCATNKIFHWTPRFDAHSDFTELPMVFSWTDHVTCRFNLDRFTCPGDVYRSTCCSPRRGTQFSEVLALFPASYRSLLLFKWLIIYF